MANKIVQVIPLDVSAQNRIQAVIAKQYDKDSRYLKVQLMSEGSPITVESNNVVTIDALRADGEAKAFLGAVNEDGTVTVPITQWMLELDDDVTCNVSITNSDGRRLSTTNFCVDVQRANYNGNASPDETEDVFTAVLARSADAIAKAEVLDSFVSVKDSAVESTGTELSIKTDAIKQVIGLSIQGATAVTPTEDATGTKLYGYDSIADIDGSVEVMVAVKGNTYKLPFGLYSAQVAGVSGIQDSLTFDKDSRVLTITKQCGFVALTKGVAEAAITAKTLRMGSGDRFVYDISDCKATSSADEKLPLLSNWFSPERVRDYSYVYASQAAYLSPGASGKSGVMLRPVQTTGATADKDALLTRLADTDKPPLKIVYPLATPKTYVITPNDATGVPTLTVNGTSVTTDTVDIGEVTVAWQTLYSDILAVCTVETTYSDTISAECIGHNNELLTFSAALIRRESTVPDLIRNDVPMEPSGNLVSFAGCIKHANINVSGSFPLTVDTQSRRRVYYVACEPDTAYTLSAESGGFLLLASCISAPANGVNMTKVVRNKCANDYSTSNENTYFTGIPVSLTTGANDKYLCFMVAVGGRHDGMDTATDIEEFYRGILSRASLVKGKDAKEYKEAEAIPDTYLGTPTLIHAPFESDGAYYAVKKAEQLLEQEWTPVANMPSMNGKFAAKVKVTGLPYSSVKAISRFIGIDVLLETFLTALSNPNSILYRYDARAGEDHSSPDKVTIYTLAKPSGTDKYIADVKYADASKAVDASHQNASCYYGTVCSTLVAYAIGMPHYQTTFSWRNANTGMTFVPDKSCRSLKRGDTILQTDAGGGGHTMVITDIERDFSGDVKYVTVIESSHPVIKRTRYAAADFVDRVLTGTDAHEGVPHNDIYRFDDLYLNGCADYDVSVLHEETYTGNAAGYAYSTYLDASYTDIGCVFLDGTEVFDYSYDKDTYKLTIWEDSVVIKHTTNAAQDKRRLLFKRLRVARLDTWRSFFAPASGYNFNDRAMLDRGNKSVYRCRVGKSGYGDPVEITAAEKVIITSPDGTTQDVSPSAETGIAVVPAGTLVPGYYTAAADGDKVNRPVEFLVYDTGAITINNAYGTDGKVQLIDGKIKGFVSGYSTELTPYYVELCSGGVVTGEVRYKSDVVKLTAPVNTDGTFEIGNFSSANDLTEDNGYIKAHYKCRYGRVVTETYKVYSVQ